MSRRGRGRSKHQPPDSAFRKSTATCLFFPLMWTVFSGSGFSGDRKGDTEAKRFPQPGKSPERVLNLFQQLKVNSEKLERHPWIRKNIITYTTS